MLKNILGLLKIMIIINAKFALLSSSLKHCNFKLYSHCDGSIPSIQSDLSPPFCAHERGVQGTKSMQLHSIL